MLYNNTETEIKLFDVHSWFDFQTPKEREKKIEKTLKYGFYKMSLQKDAPLTSEHFFLHW